MQRVTGRTFSVKTWANILNELDAAQPLHLEDCRFERVDFSDADLSTHALVNRTDSPVRWLETQAPQPPSRYQARFVADWERLISDLT